jgi:hypothetical protein
LGELLAWLLADDLGRDKLALLVLCTLAMSVLASQLSWRLRRGVGRWRGAAGRTWAGRWLAECIRLFFCVGIPLGVIWRGALVREMGLPATLVAPIGLSRVNDAFSWSSAVRWLAWLELTDLRALARLSAGLAVGTGALVALVVVWVWYARTVHIPVGRVVDTRRAVHWWDALRQALSAQFLWALYRGFAYSLVPNRAQAGMFALALISIPWALNPWHWHDLPSPRGHQVVQVWLLALFSVLVSLTANLLWFLILMHTLWVWVSGRLLAHLLEHSVGEAGITSVS